MRRIFGQVARAMERARREGGVPEPYGGVTQGARNEGPTKSAAALSERRNVQYTHGSCLMTYEVCEEARELRKAGHAIMEMYRLDEKFLHRFCRLNVTNANIFLNSFALDRDEVGDAGAANRKAMRFADMLRGNNDSCNPGLAWWEKPACRVDASMVIPAGTRKRDREPSNAKGAGKSGKHARGGYDAREVMDSNAYTQYMRELRHDLPNFARTHTTDCMRAMYHTAVSMHVDAKNRGHRWGGRRPRPPHGRQPHGIRGLHAERK